MPHQCTSCGRTFPDGSKEMLSGCPDCGGNKFQFKPANATENAGPAAEADEASDSAAGADGTPDSDSGPSDGTRPTADGEVASASDEGAAARGPDNAADATPDDRADPTPDDAVAGAESTTGSDGTEQIADRNNEDMAQASARSEVVSPDELDRASRDVDSAETSEPTDEESKPGIDALRDELNDQFESIRIVSPGQYELNLMELYDRQEYIISLQEDGRYVIEMPDAWGIDDE
ncbi:MULTISPECIES: Zn-ribbon domain-containing protein [Halorubrum]|uniref:Origin-associated protein OapC n=1 Tax=Halorubrum ezzemoulense TaxID=337243 RepID=A0A256JSS6_HALEZ|nr:MULTISPECIES: Zn-ribbon containing protein [Halorubrum]MDB2281435.1 Zn-ribbon containing protein [Halorubrum ezzemoulense]MDB9233973.1 Zn-ribbon containing protein [Halorubrum ezzemoulense]OTF00058.1 hypothetical protein B9G49_09130 [Halorubrum sp. SD683]OYR56939.1 hypothetical protein DJ83_18165 [Halorubrum ezzemoulense]OYR61895.1 hypothetical protein DJ80_11330 [Halorubrum ezzemoulense]